MEPELDVDPGRDDLPLRANTNHMLVKHYALDLTVLLQEQLIRGSVVLFLEPRPAGAGAEATVRVGATADDRTVAGTGETSSTAQKEGTTQLSQTNSCWESTSQGDFTLVLDCCDLVVFKVEEVDVSSVPDMSSLFEAVGPEGSEPSTDSQPAVLVQRLIALPSHQWRRQLHLYSQCSQAPAYQGGGPLLFHTDRWSLQVRKRGAGSPQGFPRALRVSYETKPEGGSVRWTRDQDHRMCVYTAGSPINNRALFPCQEPAVAMSTWQARVQAPQDCMVLLSGENQALPTHNQKTGSSSWEYYVTMPMPASTFTLAVGHWLQATPDLSIEGERRGQEEEAGSGALAVQAGSREPSTPTNMCSPVTTCPHSTFNYSGLEDESPSVTDCPGLGDDNIPCSHGDYPCRFTDPSAWRQWVVPHRVFAPPSLLPKARKVLLPLLPRCLAAARGTLGVHPFPRIDLLIVPAGFTSLGMASQRARHRWCELVVQHKHTQAYGDVENFLVHDQAMGVYLYGELMVHEDAQQQTLARRCLSLVQDEMDQSARRVVRRWSCSNTGLESRLGSFQNGAYGHPGGGGGGGGRVSNVSKETVIFTHFLS
ncbi:aminopeptidase O [Osmerus eperlanus]|uniref:aminopeptidase O n=1 Tax=Osmerus eperlanus TaxID=29151 RepID=UPI002E134DC8